MHEKLLSHGARHFATLLAMEIEKEFGADWEPLTVNQEIQLTANIQKQIEQIIGWQKALSASKK